MTINIIYNTIITKGICHGYFNETKRKRLTVINVRT